MEFGYQLSVHVGTEEPPSKTEQSVDCSESIQAMNAKALHWSAS